MQYLIAISILVILFNFTVLHIDTTFVENAVEKFNLYIITKYCLYECCYYDDKMYNIFKIYMFNLYIIFKTILNMYKHFNLFFQHSGTITQFDTKFSPKCQLVVSRILLCWIRIQRPNWPITSGENYEKIKDKCSEYGQKEQFLLYSLRDYG